MSDYIARSLESVLRTSVNTFRAVELTGPRQSGKTTLLRHVLRDTHDYVSLDDSFAAEEARSDPRGFLSRYGAPLIIDEFQKAPELAGFVKLRLDEQPNEKGLYVLTGSENLTVSRTVSESLAGRVAVLRLLPLTVAEKHHDPLRPLLWETDRVGEARPARVMEMWNELLRGYFPEVALDPAIDASLWYDAYVTTLIERDIRSIRNIGSLSAFRRFIVALAARAACILDLSDLARDVGVSLNTAKAWLSVLEATYQVFVLAPYWRSVGKRMVKRPKVYFTDVGLLCHLVGLRTADHALAGPMAGQIVENAVVADAFKRFYHAGRTPSLYYWRTSHGTEVDIVVDTPSGLVPIEVKASATAHRRMAESIGRFRTTFEGSVPTLPGFIVHPGEQSVPLPSDTIAIPYSEL